MKNMLMEAAARCGMELDERSAAQMAEFWAYLKEVNQSMNLTRVDSDAEAAERHFVDSLAPLKAGLIPRGARVLDVGSGAGFPGMPLSIARPDADVTLMDSLGKRVNFLSEAARRACCPRTCRGATRDWWWSKSSRPRPNPSRAARARPRENPYNSVAGEQAPPPLRFAQTTASFERVCTRSLVGRQAALPAIRSR